jgi:hypothetical protein
MKQFVTISLRWDLTLVLPLEKSVAVLELLNNSEVWFETSYNGSEEFPESDRGRSLVPRKMEEIEAKIVPSPELTEMVRKGRAEQARRDRRAAEREAERLAKEASQNVDAAA